MPGDGSTLDLLGPTKRGSLAVEDDVGGLQGNVTEDVEANVSGGLEATVALVAENGLLKGGEIGMLAFFFLSKGFKADSRSLT